MGSGLTSLDARNKAHSRLDDALDTLGVLQQPLHSAASGRPFVSRAVRQQSEAALRLAVEDLVCALLGPKARVEIEE